MEINISDQVALKKFLARRHPEYSQRLAHWRFCEETYEGGREWFRGNVFRYIKEGDQEYDDRLHRAYRFNHTREVVDLIQKYIFKSDVARNMDDAPDAVKTFWKDATLSHLPIEQYMRLVSTASSTCGRIWVFVDSTKTNEIATVADEKAAGARCYSYIVKPEDMLDMGFDEQDELNWVLVRERKRDDSDPINSTGAVEERFRLWTRTEWFLFKIDDVGAGGAGETEDGAMITTAVANAKQIMTQGVLPYTGVTAVSEQKTVVHLLQQGLNAIGCVPCFPVDNVIGDNRYFAPSLIDDIAYLDRAVANYLSNLDAIIQDQTFSQLAMPAQNMLPGEDAYEALMKLGTKRIFAYDGENGGVPFYLSPDPKQAQIIITVVNKIINEIYHSLGMGGERTKQDNAVGIDNSSGVAKAYDFERLNSLLTTKSESLQNAEDRLIEMICKWNQDAQPGDEANLVQYADTFDVRSLYDEFTVGERLQLMDAPELVRQTQMKQVIEKLFPALKAGLKKEMIAQLSAWPITGADQVQIQGVLSGNPTAVFPAKLTSTSQPGMKPQPPAAPAAKNPQTASRQGQVTSKTGK